jgi:hypothetical protein
MFRISKDPPIYYLTSVTNNRLRVFQGDKELMCGALNGVKLKWHN